MALSIPRRVISHCKSSSYDWCSDGFCWSQWAFWHREGNVRECDIDPRRREGDPSNALIQAILPNLQGDRQEAMGKMKKFRDWTTARMKEKGINSAEKMRAQALEDCRAVASLLASKGNAQEASEYRQWAIAVAEKVAMASTEGGFLGFGGERLSGGEKQLLGELKAHLTRHT